MIAPFDRSAPGVKGKERIARIIPIVLLFLLASLLPTFLLRKMEIRPLLKINYLSTQRLLYSCRIGAPLLSQLADRRLGGSVALDFHQVQDHRMMHNAINCR